MNILMYAPANDTELVALSSTQSQLQITRLARRSLAGAVQHRQRKAKSVSSYACDEQCCELGEAVAALNEARSGAPEI